MRRSPVRPLRIVLCVTALLLGPAAALDAREPTEHEQYMIELINRARIDPAAEVGRLGTGSLNEGPPTLGGEVWTIPAGPHQPLAINPAIVDTASDYASLLDDNDEFCHTCLGTDTEGRMTAAGYVSVLSDFLSGVAAYTGSYGTTSSGFVPGRENLAFRAEGPSNGMIDDLTAAVDEAHVGLFNDFTVASRGHRSTMMYGEWKEIGVGIDEGTDPGMSGPLDSLYIVCNFAHRSDTGPFITGVVYDDLVDDDFYTPDAGEPLGGVTVEAFLAGTSSLVAATTTFASGGYSLDVPPGSYDVVFSGMGVSHTASTVGVLGSGPGGIGENTKVDLVVPEPAGAGQVAAALLGLLAARRAARARTRTRQIAA